MFNVAKVIQGCADEGSTLSKAQILQANDTPILRKVLNYCLDPYKVFGIRKFEFAPPQNSANYDLYPQMFECLDKLMKREVTGDAAREEIRKTSALLTPAEQFVFHKILEKDLRCGVGEGIVNKVFPKLIPSFDVQLALAPKHIDKVKYPCLVQIKYDGVRTIALVEPKENSVIYYSRNGKQFTNFGCFDQELLLLANGSPTMFDGEIIGPLGDQFVRVMQQCRRKFDVQPRGLTFRVFDWLPIIRFVEKDCILSQRHRTKLLHEMSEKIYAINFEERRVQVVASVECRDYDEVLKVFNDAVDTGYEGIIIKDMDGMYEFKRTDVWIKLKPSSTEDLKIVEIQEGTGKYSGRVGAIVVEREGVKIGVGSGFTDDLRVTVEEAQSWIGKTVEVIFDSVTPDGSLRFPRFKQFRMDK